MTSRQKVLLAGAAFILAFAALITSGYASSSRHPASPAAPFDERPVKALLLQQQADWNRGDVTAFMQGYWDSPQLTFAGSTDFTRGWKPVLERYQRSYPDKGRHGSFGFF